MRQTWKRSAQPAPNDSIGTRTMFHVATQRQVEPQPKFASIIRR